MSNERRQIGHPYVVGGRRSGNDRRILTDERRMYPALNAARLLVAALSSAQAELSGPIIGLASILEAELDKLCSVQRKEEKIPEQWGIWASNRGNEGPPCWYCKKAGKSILELFGSEKEAQQYIRSNPNIQKWKRAGVKYDARRYDEPQEEFKDDYMGDA